MAEGRNLLDVSGVPFNKRKIQGRELQCDDIFEETIKTETIEQQEKDNSLSFCDRCFIEDLIKVFALYMCVVCEKYFCEVCFNWHNNRYKSHTVIRVKIENDGFDDFMSVVENESEKERNESLRKTNVCVCDNVYIKHELDKIKDYFIRGLTGYANKWWVVCDCRNDCIKVFSLGSNVLQRYVRLGSEPFDVTEMIVENKTTEQDSASCSETAISETDNKPDRKHLLAVTFPWKHFILIIDLGKNPAVIHSKIKTEKQCWGIDFYDGKIYIACEEDLHPPRHSVSILSVEGVTLKTFQTDFPLWSGPNLTVLNGNTYMTDRLNDRVVCYNDEGRVLHEITIAGSWPRGICVDRSEDKVYVSSYGHDNVYELESDLSRNKPVLDQTTRHMEDPWVICFYSDKLYVNNGSGSESHVTVVRLL